MPDCPTCPNHSGMEAELRKVCALLDERQKQADLRFTFMNESVRVAKEEMERRLEGMNEFRAQLESQAQTFIARPELRLEIEKLIGRILSLEKGTNYREGSKHWSDHIVTVLIAATVMFIAHYVWK